jgi:hypothetical protein
MWDLWWTKWHWGRFSPSASVSPTNSPSTDCSILSSSIVRGWYNRSNRGCGTKWTQSHPTLKKKKKTVSRSFWKPNNCPYVRRRLYLFVSPPHPPAGPSDPIASLHLYSIITDKPSQAGFTLVLAELRFKIILLLRGFGVFMYLAVANKRSLPLA